MATEANGSSATGAADSLRYDAREHGVGRRGAA